MMDAVFSLNPVLQALVATLFTWGVTALGAGVVIFTRQVNVRLMDVSLGFAGGVMIAASFWSLLAPSISMAAEAGMIPWMPAAIGFTGGALFMRLVDVILPHLHPGLPMSKAEGPKTSWQRSTLLVLAITLHNIPEGLAVGVAFGAAASGMGSATVGGAIALGIGIGLQNFPEGMAVSLPLRREGISRGKALWYGQLSGMVEPVAGVVGAAAVIFFYPLLPFALAFAAGAMIFVVVEEVIPESQQSNNSDLASIGTVLGFTLMMILDVALG
ncbi:ZIP family metal transporter [Desulfosarcina sp. OttesenSCG-928-A07]|nr:ZIP family metal transporter [Desulfosarcina sp. OttesenSCG-928-G17]MDL2329838.1 ZIP family metal transporter [Desulfosarcina sp. OttesenSCG-928-A07]